MKGYRYLIEAMADLKDTAVSLDILGEGAEEAELRELAHSLGVESIVNFRGYIDNPVDYLKQADCFVLASVSHEGSPFVLAEAMAAGLPLITSDFGPLPEINIQNETGLVVPTGDSRALSKAIRRMQSDPDLTQGMGRAALKRATQYDQRQMVTKMMEIYSKRYRQ
jgi:glycosyltransferase involved in cell wall biosynthesis